MGVLVKTDNSNHAEFYECDCHSRDHLIIVHKDTFNYSTKDGESFFDINLFLEFVITKSSYEANKFKGFKITNFFRRGWWILKEAIIILVKGSYRVEDCWMPLRMDDEIHQLVGVSETRRLGEMLIKFADDAQKFYNKNSICATKIDKIKS